MYYVKPEKNTPVKFGRGQDLPESLSKLKDVDKKICDITGGWLD